MKRSAEKPSVRPITEQKFAELSAGGKYKEGKPLPMKVGETYWVEVIPPTSIGKRL
jgi:hypothetical protein